MTIASGTQFNSYLIGESIGVGGMGEVYRATDSKLKRDVAIKVLPESFATDAERLARFQREAELLASLNHPNIAQIHGLETANGITALIMELIDGPTLAERIEQGPIPTDDALNIALQIADALEAAHERGIVHRDLKPANIKLKPDGRVKVLDFGIAKAMDNQTGNSGPQSPVLTTPAMTQSGMILGTAAYMSPEQARGKTVDRRTDIWAFGCVLYEMLTGQPAFGGEDVQETIARVITNKLELKTLPKSVPPAVKQALELCLVKDPKKRIADISDVRLALKGNFGASESESVAITIQPFWRRILPLAGALVLGGLVVGLALWFALQPQPLPLNRFSYVIPDEHEIINPGRNVLAVSPDGRRIAYTTSEGLYLREFNELEARLIPGTADENVGMPFFSPDGQSIAYVAFTESQLKRMAISGGAPVVISNELGDPHGAYWASDNSIFLSKLTTIVRFPATGGTPEIVVEAQADEQFASPELLPDGDTLIFTVFRDDDNDWNEAQIVAQSLLSRERKVLIEGGSNAHYLPGGHLLYALGDVLFGVTFDVSTLTVTGGAVPLVQPVSRATITDAANYGVSNEGSLIYLDGLNATGLRTFVWVDRTGTETELSIEPSDYAYPRISPDGEQVALDDRNPDNDIWVWNFAAETRTRLTIGNRGGYYPAWTPDGSRIAYYPVGEGTIDWRTANNTGDAETLTTNDQVFGRPGSTEISPYFFSSSGQELVFSSNLAGVRDVGMFSVGSDAEPVWLLNEPYNERNAELSPDGRWMAYESNESGKYEIYVRPFPNVNADRVQISNAGGVQPLWSPDGRELFYLERANVRDIQLMAVTLEPNETEFRFGVRTALMDWPYIFGTNGRTYDVSRDGQRFLVLKRFEDDGQEETARQVVIVQNWLQELERLVPTQ